MSCPGLWTAVETWRRVVQFCPDQHPTVGSVALCSAVQHCPACPAASRFADVVHNHGVCNAMFRHLRDTEDTRSSYWIVRDSSDWFHHDTRSLSLILGVLGRPTSKIAESASLRRLYVPAPLLTLFNSAMWTWTPDNESSIAYIRDASVFSWASKSLSAPMTVVQLDVRLLSKRMLLVSMMIFN